MAHARIMKALCCPCQLTQVRSYLATPRAQSTRPACPARLPQPHPSAHLNLLARLPACTPAATGPGLLPMPGAPGLQPALRSPPRSPARPAPSPRGYLLLQQQLQDARQQVSCALSRAAGSERVMPLPGRMLC